MKRTTMTVDGKEIKGTAEDWALKYRGTLLVGDEFTSYTLDLFLTEHPEVLPGCSYRMADRVLQKGRKKKLWSYKGGFWRAV